MFEIDGRESEFSSTRAWIDNAVRVIFGVAYFWELTVYKSLEKKQKKGAKMYR